MLGNLYSTYLHYVKWTGSFQYGVTCAWKTVAFYNRCWGNVLDRDIDSKVICKHKHWKYQEKYIAISGTRGKKKVFRRNWLWSPPNKYNSEHAHTHTHTHTHTQILLKNFILSHNTHSSLFCSFSNMEKIREVWDRGKSVHNIKKKSLQIIYMKQHKIIILLMLPTCVYFHQNI